MVKKAKATKLTKKTQNKLSKKQKKFYVLIKGKKYFINSEVIERYHFKGGERFPFSNLKIYQEK